MIEFVISDAKDVNSRLTIAKEETRLKLNSSDDKDRVIKFTKNIDNYIRTNNLLRSTLRGSFHLWNEHLEIRLNDKHNAILKFIEDSQEPTKSPHFDEYLKS